VTVLPHHIGFLISYNNAPLCGLLQHLILFLKVTIAYLIPDMPEWVETAVASDDYQSKLALKRQVSLSVCEVSISTFRLLLLG